MCICTLYRDGNLPAFGWSLEVILGVCLNLGRKVVCVYVKYNRQLLTPCSSAAITSAISIPIQFVLSWLGGILFENGLMLHTNVTYLHFVEACKPDWQGKIGL